MGPLLIKNSNNCIESYFVHLFGDATLPLEQSFSFNFSFLVRISQVLKINNFFILFFLFLDVFSHWNYHFKDRITTENLSVLVLKTYLDLYLLD